MNSLLILSNCSHIQKRVVQGGFWLS